MIMMMDEDDDDDDDDDGDDAQKMTGDLSCGGKIGNMHAIPVVSTLAIFSPMELRMNHAK